MVKRVVNSCKYVVLKPGRRSLHSRLPCHLTASYYSCHSSIVVRISLGGSLEQACRELASTDNVLMCAFSFLPGNRMQLTQHEYWMMYEFLPVLRTEHASASGTRIAKKYGKH